MTVPLLEFVRLVVDGDVAELSRRLAVTPGLATAAASVGATRQGSSTFFFADIRHYMYAGDTALHMAAAAFNRPIAEVLVKHGADCRARNRRGAEPLHYAADANHWDPAAQADTIEYLISAGADPNAVDDSGVAPIHRAVRTRSPCGGRPRGRRPRSGTRLCRPAQRGPSGWRRPRSAAARRRGDSARGNRRRASPASQQSSV